MPNSGAKTLNPQDVTHLLSMVTVLTLGLRSKKSVLILRNWIHFVPIFLKLSYQYFSKVRLLEVKISLLFKFLIFNAIM
jgi:hypothetical protein